MILNYEDELEKKCSECPYFEMESIYGVCYQEKCIKEQNES